MRLSKSKLDKAPFITSNQGRKQHCSLPEPLPATQLACEQVFAAVELLEGVLLHLDMRDLLRVQRVSMHWQAVIKTSPTLQRKQFLGFVPKSGNLSRFVYDNHRDPNAAACITARMSGKGFTMGGIPESPSTASLGVLPEVPGEEQIPVQFNPVFPCDGQTIRMQTSQFRTKPDAIESWLDMYVTQMPCSDVHVGLYYVRKREWKSRFGLIRRSDEPVIVYVPVHSQTGVRARDVLEALAGACSEDPRRWQRIDIRVPWTTRA
ncbi:Putative F-box-like domain superfamily protein [Septoria linicola]|uniref:F-box-like domain superfamily protein n=1 Tax=Septoria linicola TaxID=215465 RepID=A0A9Q9EG89_9PEZI|nr:putative F-box-like domain superfamily protein [Septoria linicola]USW49725.1 Putative F-box-like domain superfamily protein [Septoria linicola]